MELVEYAQAVDHSRMPLLLRVLNALGWYAKALIGVLVSDIYSTDEHRYLCDVCDELPAGCGAWRTWQVPIARDRRATDDTLALLERCERQLQDRQNVVDELRRVVMRCVPCGAVTLTTTEKFGVALLPVGADASKLNVLDDDRQRGRAIQRYGDAMMR